MKTTFILSLVIVALACPGYAAQSSWVETDGGAMRVLVSDNAQNQARGVLEIKLNPGWKTYWREPGDGGIPPSLTSDGIALVLLFPAPERITANDLAFNGYQTGVSFPFSLPNTAASTLNLSAFVGICSEVCVPFQADFKLNRDRLDGDTIDSAFSKLPEQANSESPVLLAARIGNELHLKAPIGAEELFLAPDKGLYLEHPKRHNDGFSARIFKEKTAGVRVNYTLKTNDGAMSGSFNMPR